MPEHQPVSAAMTRARILLSTLLLLVSVHGPGWAQEFHTWPTRLSCKSTSLGEAGGDPGTRFEITLTGRCLMLVWVEAEQRHAPFDMWTVDIVGSYDYATRKARERISRHGATIQDAIVTCPQNPWAHARFCDEDSTQVVARKDHMTVDDPAPVSATLVGADLRTSLAAWEAAPPDDDLDDWDPHPQKTAAKVAIVEPAGHVPVEGGEVPLELQAQTPLHSTVVELEWAKIVESKDPSLGPESWLEGQPENAPTEFDWSALPTTIPMAGLFDVGSYAVRAKMEGDPESSWTDWTRFVVAGSEIDRDLIRNAPDVRMDR